MIGCRLLVVGCWLLVVGSFGWKPIPSEARVTRDKVSGYKKTYIQLSISPRDFVPGYSRFARFWLPDRVCCFVVLLFSCLSLSKTSI